MVVHFVSKKDFTSLITSYTYGANSFDILRRRRVRVWYKLLNKITRPLFRVQGGMTNELNFGGEFARLQVLHPFRPFMVIY